MTYPFSRALVVVMVGRALRVVDKWEYGGAGLVDAEEVVATRRSVPYQT